MMNDRMAVDPLMMQQASLGAHPFHLGAGAAQRPGFSGQGTAQPSALAQAMLQRANGQSAVQGGIPAGPRAGAAPGAGG